MNTSLPDMTFIRALELKNKLETDIAEFCKLFTEQTLLHIEKIEITPLVILHFSDYEPPVGTIKTPIGYGYDNQHYTIKITAKLEDITL